MGTAHLWAVSTWDPRNSCVLLWGFSLAGKVAVEMYDLVGSFCVRGIFLYLHIYVVLTASLGRGNSYDIQVHEPELGAELGFEPRSDCRARALYPYVGCISSFTTWARGGLGSPRFSYLIHC